MKNIPDKKLVFYRTISILITLIGMALITYLINIERELGLLPIVLVLVGTTTSIYCHIKLNRTKQIFKRTYSPLNK